MLTQQEATREVRENILPFWQNMADKENGGFYGEADFYGNINKTAGKGGILNSRILWTFSAAHRIFKDEAYRQAADRARDFLNAAFLDKTNGGLYWLADHEGKMLDGRKQFYNIAFGIYALAEHYMAFGENSSLDTALSLFETMEKYGLDRMAGGYIEACTVDWQTVSDSRLSAKDVNSPKSMNTNLHVLEAYTGLLNACGDKRVYESLWNLLRVTLDKIINHAHNFELFFDMEWNSLIKDVSYGHDIEGSWLLYEAALALKNEDLVAEVKQTALNIAEATYNAAIDHKNGGLLSGHNGEGKIIPRKEWWPQAEAVAGFYNAYELSGEGKYLEAAEGIWKFILKHYTDPANGEWHNELSLDNIPDPGMPKAGFWKCPYHNARVCFEIIKRFK